MDFWLPCAGHACDLDDLSLTQLHGTGRQVTSRPGPHSTCRRTRHCQHEVRACGPAGGACRVLQVPGSVPRHHARHQRQCGGPSRHGRRTGVQHVVPGAAEGRHCVRGLLSGRAHTLQHSFSSGQAEATACLSRGDAEARGPPAGVPHAGTMSGRQSMRGGCGAAPGRLPCGRSYEDGPKALACRCCAPARVASGLRGLLRG